MAGQTEDLLQQLLDRVTDLTEGFKESAEQAKLETAASKQRQAALTAQRQAEKEVAERMRAITGAVRTAEQAFGQAANFAKNLAAQANPTAWATLQDSLKLVIGQLGLHFLPAIITGAYYAQEFAHWLANLSPETKTLITRVATAAAGVYVFSKALQFVNALTLGLAGKGIAAAVVGIAGLSASTLGLGAAFVALAAATAAAHYALKRLADHIEEQARERLKPAEQKFTREQLESSDVYKKLAGIQDPEERRKAAFQIQSDLAANEKKARERLDSTSPFAVQPRLQAEFGAQLATDKTDLAKAAIAELVHGQTFVPQGKGVDSLLGPAAKQAERLSSLLMHFPKEMQPRFSAVEEARKQLQLGALKDPLEQAQLEQNRKATAEFLRLAPILIRRLQHGEPLFGAGLGG